MSFNTRRTGKPSNETDFQNNVLHVTLSCGTQPEQAVNARSLQIFKRKQEIFIEEATASKSRNLQG